MLNFFRQKRKKKKKDAKAGVSTFPYILMNCQAVIESLV